MGNDYYETFAGNRTWPARMGLPLLGIGRQVLCLKLPLLTRPAVIGDDVRINGGHI